MQEGKGRKVLACLLVATLSIFWNGLGKKNVELQFYAAQATSTSKGSETLSRISVSNTSNVNINDTTAVATNQPSTDSFSLVKKEDQKSCPPRLFSFDGTWIHQDHDVWLWKNTDGRNYSSESSQQHPAPLSSILQRRDNASLVLYGSSHLREVYFNLVRQEQGLRYNATLPDVVKEVHSGSQWKSRLCDSKQKGFRTGLFGIDLIKCGPPGRRMIPEIDVNRTAYAFKAFLHTPDAEDHFLQFLTNHSLRSPSTIVLDVGVWGCRGAKLGGSVNYTMTRPEEVDYYLQWSLASFPNSHVIFLLEPAKSPVAKMIRRKALQLEKSQDRVHALRKDVLMQNLPPELPCDHGCAGPVTHVVASVLAEWMECQ